MNNDFLYAKENEILKIVHAINCHYFFKPLRLYIFIAIDINLIST